jgi:hypothetical protein
VRLAVILLLRLLCGLGKPRPPIHLEDATKDTAPLHQLQLVELMARLDIAKVAVARQHIHQAGAHPCHRLSGDVRRLDKLLHHVFVRLAALLRLCLVLHNVLDHRMWVEDKLHVVVALDGVGERCHVHLRAARDTGVSSESVHHTDGGVSVRVRLQSWVATADSQLETERPRQHPHARGAALARVGLLRGWTAVVARLAPRLTVCDRGRHAPRATAAVLRLELGVHAAPLADDHPILRHVTQAVVVARAVEHGVGEDGGLVLAA